MSECFRVITPSTVDLSPRELKTLDLASRGLPYADNTIIGYENGIPITPIKNLKQELGVGTLEEAVDVAISTGLLEVEIAGEPTRALKPRWDFILKASMRGLSTLEMAAEAVVSVSTIKDAGTELNAALGATNRFHRIRRAYEEGLLAHGPWPDNGTESDKPLSDVELAELEMASKGMMNKEIAAEQGIAYATVKGHRTETLKKLGAINTAHAVYMAIKTGLIPIEWEPNTYNISRRQAQILRLIALGSTEPETAEILGIAESTIGLHRGDLYRELGVGTAGHAVRRAFEIGIFAVTAPANDRL